MIGPAQRRALCYVAANPDLALDVIAGVAGVPAGELAVLAGSPVGQRFVRAMRGVPELLEGLAIEAPAEPTGQAPDEPQAARPASGPSPVQATRIDESELSEYMQSLVARAYLATE